MSDPRAPRVPLTLPEGEPPLPELHEAVVPWATVDALIADVSAAAELEEVMVKRDPRRHAAQTEVDLAAARALLASGEAMAIQLRYRFQGAHWCDTLLRVGDGVRIVRMRQQ
jgi:hypothetical protein